MNSNLMDQEVKRKWVEALRSDEFSQITGRLRSQEGFCCLGVLCNLHAKESCFKWQSDWEKSWYSYLDELEALPEEVIEWAGLSDPDPEIAENYELKSLGALNDSGKTFQEIADLIEEQL